MAEYKLRADSENGVIRTADNANIPPDVNNKDWQEYQAWLAVPNTPDPADE